MVTFVETAGGVLSPSSSSPLNTATNSNVWGWTTQAQVYHSFRHSSSVVLVGDGKLGGISCTITALEALLHRGYTVDSVVFVDGDNVGLGNREALMEYVENYNYEINELYDKTEDENKLQDKYHSEKAQSNQNHNPVNVPRQQNQLQPTDIFSLPSIPPLSEPLDQWFQNTGSIFNDIQQSLEDKKTKPYHSCRCKVVIIL